MKRYFILPVLVIIMFSISGCSSEPNLEIISPNVNTDKQVI